MKKAMKEIEVILQETNLLNPNFYTGVNETCKQCVNDCKQFRKTVLINCPKIKLASQLKK